MVFLFRVEFSFIGLKNYRIEFRVIIVVGSRGENFRNDIDIEGNVSM